MNQKKIVQYILIGILVMAFFAGINTLFYQYITTASESLENDAEIVSLASRQSAMTQQIARTLYQMQQQQSRDRSINSLLAELESGYEGIEQTLTGLSEGGTVTSLDGSEFFLPKAPTDDTARLVKQARRIWNPYAKGIKALLETGPEATERDIQKALRSVSRGTNPLAAITNKISVELENWAREKATRQQFIIVVIAVVIVNALLILIYLTYATIRGGLQLRITTGELTAAKGQTDSILHTIREGLILIDKEFRIGPVQSAETKALLRMDDLEGKHLLAVLKPHIPEALFGTANEYIKLMFKKRVKERLIVELNPLNEVEINFDKAGGGFETFYYSFGFNRIVEQGEVTQILVTMTDITKRILLSQQLQKFEAEASEQVNLVFNIIHVPPADLDQFINRMKRSLDHVNETLKKDEGVGSHHETLDELFRIAHVIKGDAATLGLDLFEAKFNQFESVISDLKNTPGLTGNDFLRLTVMLDGLFDTVTSVKSLIGRLTAIQQQFGTEDKTVEYPTAADLPALDAFQRSVEKITEQLCARQDKLAVVDWSGFTSALIPSGHSEQMLGVVIQLVRNAISHGIEPPAARQKRGKSPQATIRIQNWIDNNRNMMLAVQDDGQGLQLDQIRAQAIASGKWPKQDIAKWDAQKTISVIFQPGFSTVVEANQDAGRGVGMDVVKTNVARMNGRVKVSTSKGKFCEFRIVTPTSNAA
ncbi:MAG: Hpt domain-containing protein [Immundisolibacteraceae bacterium]|nr:Hpt domain-containing protein [Immundisolibacteraceae bacterium]